MYCRYSLSYRDLEEIVRERGLSVDHTTVWRWVQRYAPEINKRMRPHLKMSGTSYRLDETYVKVGTEWKYLYRAVDSAGQTIEFRDALGPADTAAQVLVVDADLQRQPFPLGPPARTGRPYQKPRGLRCPSGAPGACECRPPPVSS